MIIITKELYRIFRIPFGREFKIGYKVLATFAYLLIFRFDFLLQLIKVTSCANL